VNAQQTAADLLSAANHIETYGHRKGWYGSAGMPCCVRGAMQVAIYGATIDEDEWQASDEKNERDEAATDALSRHIGFPVVSIWNDSERLTAEQVVHALRGAAKRVFPDA
jgi:hypothetical protein